MGNGFQFFDIILFGMIAVFLVFRLRNTLGKRDGKEGDYNDPFKPSDNEEKTDSADDDNVVHFSDRQADQANDDQPADEVGFNNDADGAVSSEESDALVDGMIQIQMIDRSFDSAQFMSGARGAFEMTLNAYAAGDTQTLKSLLSTEVYSNFAQAIKDREQSGEVLEDTLVGFKRSDYLEAYVEARQAYLTVKFVSEQVNVTRDENGDVVDGDPNQIITVTDIWTFSRDTRSRDPNWVLVATSSLD